MEINQGLIEKKVAEFQPSSSLTKTGYEPDFYSHLTELFKFKLVNDIHVQINHIGTREYYAAEQFTLENSSIIEPEMPKQIDWDLVGNARDIFSERIKKTLGFESKSSFLQPIINSTLDLYENSVIYEQMHPQSLANPWLPTNNSIFHNGYLLLVSDKNELLSEYSSQLSRKIRKIAGEDIGVVAKSGKQKKLSAFIVDDRISWQTLVFEFIKNQALGRHNAVSMRNIRNFLGERNITIGDNDIRNKVVLPLKRAGIIGSSTTGFYYILDEEDLLHTYEYHENKLMGIIKTLEMYEKKAEKIGIVMNKIYSRTFDSGNNTSFQDTTNDEEIPF